MPEKLLLSILLALATMLVAGRGAAEIARRTGQPEVVGELLGGLVIGPSVLGKILPDVEHFLFSGAEVQLALQTVSWIGALLLLLIAGLEADLRILKPKAKPGLLAAFLAIVPSLLLGVVFSHYFLGKQPAGGIFFGIVLSVTAVSVAAKILMETESLRRDYAQVIIAGGIFSEIVVWLLISIVASLGSGNELQSAEKTSLFAAAFLILMLTVGKRITFWLMRRVSDLTFVAHGLLTSMLILCFICAAATQAMGLHPLLGAFILGVLLNQSPRIQVEQKKQLQTLTLGFFAPIFFVLAGMKVDILQLGNSSTLGIVLLLLLLSAIVKVGLGTLGAKLGGLRGYEALLVGLGLNLKGGTDIVVAILGRELGLLQGNAYTIYTMAAILTVVVSPSLMTVVQKRVPLSKEEEDRLHKDEAKKRAYLADVERVLAPVVPELFPSLPATVLHAVANGKHEEHEVFDITTVSIDDSTYKNPQHRHDIAEAHEKLTEANELETVELMKKEIGDHDIADQLVEAANNFKVIAIGANRPRLAPVLSLGTLQDEIIRRTRSDVMVVIRDEGKLDRPIKRILVPVNGQEHAAAAADIAAYIARSTKAELVLFNMMHWEADYLFWREAMHPELLDAGYRILHEVKFRTERLDIKTAEKVRVGDDPVKAIVGELQRSKYDLLVLGALERKAASGILLGKHTQSILTQCKTPVVLLISHAVALAA